MQKKSQVLLVIQKFYFADANEDNKPEKMWKNAIRTDMNHLYKIICVLISFNAIQCYSIAKQSMQKTSKDLIEYFFSTSK